MTGLILYKKVMHDKLVLKTFIAVLKQLLKKMSMSSFWKCSTKIVTQQWVIDCKYTTLKMLRHIFSVHVSVVVTRVSWPKVIISDYHNMKLWDLEFSWNRYILNYHHVTDHRYFQILRKSIQKERFKWPVKDLQRPEKD